MLGIEGPQGDKGAKGAPGLVGTPGFKVSSLGNFALYTISLKIIIRVKKNVIVR
jgi:hypothetical protein